MNFILSLPIELRLAVLFLLGAILGGQLNRGIYRLAYHPRDIGPWSLPHPNVPPRRWYDRVPIFGWLALARESSIHGKAYWVRPLLIELLTAVGFAALYLWETGGHHIPWKVNVPPLALQVPAYQAMLHAQFAAHLVLISFLIVATFIDFDEKSIPDAVTIPGTLVGLLLAALLPFSRLPVTVPLPGPPGYDLSFLKLTSPQMEVVSNWPDWINGREGLAIGILCFVSWCIAILPATLWARSGLVKAVQYYFASIARHPMCRYILLMAVVGSAAIFGVWAGTARGSVYWQALLSALVGMVFAGGLVWAVRIIGSRVLAKEAMGFGDVTLMAMIGTFVGWQPSLIIFFLAPVTGLVIAVTQWLLTRRKDIAYGPFLSLGTLILILWWGDIWNRWGWPVFRLGGWWIVAVLAVCLLLMGGMLGMWRAVTERGE